MKDKLFIVRPGFYKDAEGPFYCSDSVAVEGLLSFFPELRDAVDVVYIDAPRPRNAIIELIGEENQSLPVIVLGTGKAVKDASLALQQHNGRQFINVPDDIRRYLSSQYGVAHMS